MGGQLRTPKLSLEGRGCQLRTLKLSLTDMGGPFRDIVITFGFFLGCGFPKMNFTCFLWVKCQLICCPARQVLSQSDFHWQRGWGRKQIYNFCCFYNPPILGDVIREQPLTTYQMAFLVLRTKPENCDGGGREGGEDTEVRTLCIDTWLE